MAKRKQGKRDLKGEKERLGKMRDTETARKETLLVRKRDYVNNGRH